LHQVNEETKKEEGGPRGNLNAPKEAKRTALKERRKRRLPAEEKKMRKESRNNANQKVVKNNFHG